MSSFSDQQQSLQKDMDNETEWMNRIKEALSKCDDVTGSKEELLKRFETCKVKDLTDFIIIQFNVNLNIQFTDVL